jgi:DNA invertase Pin-like site-specific DNA recombinase
MASAAELEAGFIGDRTKAALAAARKRGKRLGGKRKGQKLLREWRQRGSAATASKAAARAAVVAPIISELQANGATSLCAIAAGLHEREVPTARGNGTWSAVPVARVLARQQHTAAGR